MPASTSIRTLLLPLIIATSGCCDRTDTGRPPGDTGSGPPAPGTVYGVTADQGFGSAVATSSDGIWVGAPHADGGHVYLVEDDTPVELLAGEGRLGSAIAAWGTGVIVGDPLHGGANGRVLDQDGSLIAQGGGSLGLAIAAEPGTDGSERWVAAMGTGWLASDAHSESSPERPSSMAMSGASIGIGMARGDVALSVSGLSVSGLSWDRPVAVDEAGYALAAGDIDGDGDIEWLVGAPGSSTVYVLDSALEVQATITGTGRFGASLAVADVNADGIADVAVGAPMSGTGLQGAVHLFLGPDLSQPSASWEGKGFGDQLGFSVALTEGRLVMGAPAASQRTGFVRVVEWD